MLVNNGLTFRFTNEQTEAQKGQLTCTDCQPKMRTCNNSAGPDVGGRGRNDGEAMSASTSLVVQGPAQPSLLRN